MEEYIYIDNSNVDQYYLSNISFANVYRFILKRPDILLLLEHRFEELYGTCFDKFIYVQGKELKKLLADRISIYPDFCCVDCKEIIDLYTIPKEEKIELLCLPNLQQPFKNFLVPTLGNTFAYFTHDDGFNSILWTKRNITDIFKCVLDFSIHNFFGKEKNFIFENYNIVKLLNNGVVIKYEDSYFDKKKKTFNLAYVICEEGMIYEKVSNSMKNDSNKFLEIKIL